MNIIKYKKNYIHFLNGKVYPRIYIYNQTQPQN